MTVLIRVLSYVKFRLVALKSTMLHHCQERYSNSQSKCWNSQGPLQITVRIRAAVVVCFDGVRKCLRNAASNRPIINLQGDIRNGELQWNGINWRKPKNSEKILSQCHFVHRKSHMD
jgi:hypothetical protein